MLTVSTRLPSLLARFLALVGAFCASLARGQVYLTPNDVVLPPEKASQEAVDQSAGRASMRFLGLDIFPHAAVNALYDDNLFITDTNPVSDLKWTLSPGVTIVKGDVSTYLPGAVTLAQVRDLLDYSLVDDSDRPQRYVALDYTPGINFYTKNSGLNDVDEFAGFSAGYAFARLAVGLDQDYSHAEQKNNEVGTLLTSDLYETKIRTRYELTERSTFEVNGKYTLLDYPDDPQYQGFQQFQNENWYNRQVGSKVNAGFGLGFGVVFPEVQASQTFEQAAVRAIYRVTGKMDIRLTLGAEYRQYGSGIASTLYPIFNLTGIYQVSDKTVLTLSGYRVDYPSPFGDYNYETLGAYGGVRQELVGGWSVSLALGYDYTDYVYLLSGPSVNRTDGYFNMRASVNYEMNRHVTAMLYYIRRQDDSNIQQYTYSDNMVGLQLSWNY